MDGSSFLGLLFLPHTLFSKAFDSNIGMNSVAIKEKLLRS